MDTRTTDEIIAQMEQMIEALPPEHDPKPRRVLVPVGVFDPPPLRAALIEARREALAHIHAQPQPQPRYGSRIARATAGVLLVAL